jgi:hypothetical protein
MLLGASLSLAKRLKVNRAFPELIKITKRGFCVGFIELNPLILMFE